MRAFWLLPLALAGCSGDEQFLVVTVETRPAVHDADTLKITLSNDSTMVSQDFELGEVAFPATVSISAAGRTGALGIAVEAFDEAGLLVGSGATETTVDRDTATVMVESVDFVLNSDFADDQELSNYYSAHGFQLGATLDGNWTAVYSNFPCNPCNVMGRRFDQTGRPIVSQESASTNAFPLSNRLTTSWSTPAVAASGTATIAVWNADDPNVVGAAGYSIECRAFDANGGALTNQIQIATDELPFLVAATPLSNGNFAIAWEGRVTNDLIRSAVVRPDCTTLGVAQSVSTVLGTLGPERSSVAASADRIMFAWILDGNVRARVAQNGGGFATGDLQLFAKSATEEIEHVRVAPLAGGGFAILMRWALSVGLVGPGRIELLRVNSMGVAMGIPTIITERSGSDGPSKESFGVASQPDGSLLVVWHACADNGDDSGCGVFGRMVDSTGTPAGEAFNLATTTMSDQVGPSAIALPNGAFATAWTDKSGLDPDRAGAAVRARIIYPTTGSAAGSAD